MRESQEIAAEFSFDKEKAIAKSFSQRFQWEMILIGLGQAAHLAFSVAISSKWFFGFMGRIFNCELYVHVLPTCLRMKLSTEIILEAIPNSDGLIV